MTMSVLNVKAQQKVAENVDMYRVAGKTVLKLLKQSTPTSVKCEGFAHCGLPITMTWCNISSCQNITLKVYAVCVKQYVGTFGIMEQSVMDTAQQ